MKEMFIQHNKKVLIGIITIAVLAAAFFWGGSYPKSDTASASEITVTENTQPTAAAPEAPEVSRMPDSSSAPLKMEQAASPKTAEIIEPEQSPTPDVTDAGSQADSTAGGRMAIDPKTGKDKYQTGPAPEGRPVPVEPQDTARSDKALTCTLSVRCDTLLNNMDLLDREKWELVPEEGVIFAAKTVIFHEGESVLNILQREMKRAGIQMEFSTVPMYNSAYIEGINNLYEFDAGELSGWMYKVNGWFPNYGCSRYQLKQGDVVEWLFTCDLGKDVGGYYALGGGT